MAVRAIRLDYNDFLSPADREYASYLYRNPRTLLTGSSLENKFGCPACDQTTAKSRPSNIAAAIEDWQSAKRSGDPRRLVVSARNAITTVADQMRPMASQTVPAEGIRPEDAIAITLLLKEIAKHLPEDCVEEWERAFELCAKELAKPNPSRTFTGGHKTLQGCAKGLVSDRCGGNAVSIERR